MTIFWSDLVGCGRIIVESSFYWKAFREFPLKSWASRFRGRRSVWWGWRVTLLAPRIGNEVAYVTQIIDDLDIAWQAQYLVRLAGDFTFSAHWKWSFICHADHWWRSFCVAGAVFGDVGGWLYLLHALEMWRFICDADHWWHSFCVAGAVFGEVRVGLFVAGAALRDILGDSWSAKCCILQYKIVSKMGRVRSSKRRVRDDDFIVGLCSDIVGYPRIVFLLAEALQGVSNQILSFKISWQAQYLVRLEGDFTCSAHWKWRFICRADHRWRSFCLAGAVFGEVGGWLYLLHALEMTFHMSRRSLMTCILRGRRSFWWGWRVTLLAPRIGNEVAYVTQIIDDLDIAWQAQYLVRLAGDFTFSAHWKWSFICHADHWWRSFCVAGAVFGEVGGWLYLLHALEMMFHMWGRSLMT